jgi:hypothetical protein
LERGDATLSLDFDQLNRSAYQNVLVSAEDLSDLSEQALGHLKSLTEGSEVIFVFYCRRWSETVPSLWQECVKHGQAFSLPEYYLHEWHDARRSKTINIAVRLDKFASMFGVKAIRLVSYSNISDIGGDILSHFLREFLSIAEFPPVGNKRANLSLSPFDAEIIRVLNGMEWSIRGRRGTGIMTRYMANKLAFRMEATKAAVSNHLASIAMDDDTPELQSLHRSLGEKFSNVLVNPADQGHLFRPKRRLASYVQPGYIFVDGVYDELRAIYNVVGAA